MLMILLLFHHLLEACKCYCSIVIAMLLKMILNSTLKKSKCMIFQPKCLHNPGIHQLMLSSKTLSVVEDHNYLGAGCYLRQNFHLPFGQVTSKIHLPEFKFACQVMFMHFNE
jgi:hypothetical protein